MADATSQAVGGKDFTGKTIGVPTLLDMQAISMITWIDATGVRRS